MSLYPLLKRIIDIGISAALLLALAPVLVAVAILVLMDSGGPAIFRQQRVGRGGSPFEMYKFRSMKQGAPDIRHGDGSTFNAEDDPRVTRVGRWLRAWSIDELPQLWNVLMGQMSLVGGRPDLPEAVSDYTDQQRDRLLVRPGVTSLAIVRGRNNVPVQERRDLDAWYARNLSFALDCRILLRTARMVLRREGIVNEYSKAFGPPVVKAGTDESTRARKQR